MYCISPSHPFQANPNVQQCNNSKIEIIRVSQDIIKEEAIIKDMIQIVEVGEYNLSDTIIREKENIIGKYANSDIYKEDYLMQTSY